MALRFLLSEGQSNKLGFGTIGGTPPTGLPIAAVKQFVRNNQIGTMQYSSSVLENLDVINPAPNPTYFGPDLQCAIDLHDAGEDVRLIHFGANGTSVVSWAPGNAAENDALLTTACLGGRTTSDSGPYSIHLLSTRGEEEATNASNVGATNYFANYVTSFIDPLTEMWGVTPRIQCGRVYTNTLGGLWVPLVQEAQGQLVTTYGGNLWNTDSLVTIDDTHYDAPSQIQLGHWYAQGILNEINGGGAQLFFGGKPL